MARRTRSQTAAAVSDLVSHTLLSEDIAHTVFEIIAQELGGHHVQVAACVCKTWRVVAAAKRRQWCTLHRGHVQWHVNTCDLWQFGAQKTVRNGAHTWEIRLDPVLLPQGDHLWDGDEDAAPGWRYLRLSARAVECEQSHGWRKDMSLSVDIHVPLAGSKLKPLSLGWIACNRFSDTSRERTWPDDHQTHGRKLFVHASENKAVALVFVLRIKHARPCDAGCERQHWDDGACLDCGIGYGPHNEHFCPCGRGVGGARHSSRRGRWLCAPCEDEKAERGEQSPPVAACAAADDADDAELNFPVV